ncbi:hypothetical protein Tco_0209566 [Tanacetum coccineum]
MTVKGVRPIKRMVEEIADESTAGRTMELVLEQPEFDSTDVLAPTPLRSVPGLKEMLEKLTWVETSRGPPIDDGCSTSKRECTKWMKEIQPAEVHVGICQAEAKSRGQCTRSLPRKKWHLCLSRWLISHGLRLAAMSTLESQEVKQSFGDVVTCALARGKAEAVEELHEKKLLTVPAAQVPGYNDKAYEELVAAMEAMKLLELPHIAQLERDQDYPIDVIMAGLTLARHATEGAEGQPDYFLKPDVAQLQVPIFARPRDILNPFALEREIPLKETLEAHAIRLAKKKGVKGKAILCGVGAAHIPRSDGVPVSVAAVSPKDSELLGKLEEAGDAAYQVGSSGARRCHSI